MNVERLFRILSYAAVFCGFFSLWVAGTFGFIGTFVFLACFIGAWFLEASRFQINDRIGTVMVVLTLPVYYVVWKAGFFQFTTSEAELAGILARLILTLTVIKLLQKKSDRDWIFLYMMAFFEVLLAAGFSISALYFASFVLYAFVMISTIIVFEMRKTEAQTRSTANFKDPKTPHLTGMRTRRVPITAAVLLVLIAAFALPMFFLLPRVGGAGLGGSAGRGMATFSGFSDTVNLGQIGRIQENDEVVMRVRIDDRNRERLAGRIRWRGVALDTFTGKSWSKSKAAVKEVHQKGPLDLINVDYVRNLDSVVAQTIYLEPLDSPVLFVLPRAVGVQANFQMLFTDTHGSISFTPRGDRISYTVHSDVSLPPETRLQADRKAYAANAENYLQLPPRVDPRIEQLAARITANTRNRYDAARVIEQYLQTQFGYTLEQKAGGDDPLADFLFNIREGHCEYFATAMAIMLRTQGIATRVVNGFTQGNYNETADMLVVRQRNAHSWVEVYFPGEETWVTFDPTPAAGQDLTNAASSYAIAERFNKYVEALEAFWIQYFVAFDNQEQRSMFSSIRRGVRDYGTKTAVWTDGIQQRIEEWWSDIRGDQGMQSSLRAIGFAALYAAGAMTAILLFVWLYRRIVKLGVWRRLWDRLFARRQASIVEFYERMVAVLAGKGFVREPHQTPLEFAFAVGMPEAVKVTEKYNGVRFGEKDLSIEEAKAVEEWLIKIKEADLFSTEVSPR